MYRKSISKIVFKPQLQTDIMGRLPNKLDRVVFWNKNIIKYKMLYVVGSTNTQDSINNTLF